ncbi:hypothetical protein FBU31_006465, partial [Coemansia sp. 'formosensis']
MLREAGISKQDQEANPQAVVEVMRFYQENTKHQDDMVWQKMASLEQQQQQGSPASDAGRQQQQQGAMYGHADARRGSPPPQLPQIGENVVHKKPSNINTTSYARRDEQNSSSSSSQADQYSPQYQGSHSRGQSNAAAAAGAGAAAAHAPYRSHQHTNSDGSRQQPTSTMNQVQHAFDEDAEQTRYRQPQRSTTTKGHYGAQPKAHGAQPGPGPAVAYQQQQSAVPVPSAQSSSSGLKKQPSYNVLQQQAQQQQQIQDQQQHALKRGATLPSNHRDNQQMQQPYPGMPAQGAQQPMHHGVHPSASTSGLKKQSSNHQLKRGPVPQANPYGQPPPQQQQQAPQVQQAMYQSKPAPSQTMQQQQQQQAG